MTTSESRAQALHEAGHLVAFKRLFDQSALAGLIPWQVYGQIVLPSDTDADSCFLLDFPADDTRTAAGEATTRVAGYAATIAAGVPEDHARRIAAADIATAAELLRAFGLDVEQHIEATMAMMATPQNRQAVAVVADMVERLQLVFLEEATAAVDAMDAGASPAEAAHAATALVFRFKRPRSERIAWIRRCYSRPLPADPPPPAPRPPAA